MHFLIYALLKKVITISDRLTAEKKSIRWSYQVSFTIIYTP